MKKTKKNLFPANEDSMQEVKSFPDVIKQLLSAGLIILFGQPKSGKTMISIAIAKAVALGRSFLGRSVNPGVVLYLALDDRDSTIAKRFGKKCPENLRVFNYREYKKVIKNLIEIRKKELITLGKEIIPLSPQQELIMFVNTFCKVETTPILVVVDTLQKIRSSTQDTRYYNEVLELSEFRSLTELGISIMFVHHATKDKNTSTFYGSNGLFAEVDTLISIEKLENNRVKITPTSNSFADDPLYAVINFNNGKVTHDNDDGRLLEDMDPDIREVCKLVSKEGVWEGRLADLGLKLKNPTLNPINLGRKMKKHSDEMRALGIYYKSYRDGSIRMIRLIKVDSTISNEKEDDYTNDKHYVSNDETNDCIVIDNNIIIDNNTDQLDTLIKGEYVI